MLLVILSADRPNPTEVQTNPATSRLAPTVAQSGGASSRALEEAASAGTEDPADEMQIEDAIDTVWVVTEMQGFPNDELAGSETIEIHPVEGDLVEVFVFDGCTTLRNVAVAELGHFRLLSASEGGDAGVVGAIGCDSPFSDLLRFGMQPQFTDIPDEVVVELKDLNNITLARGELIVSAERDRNVG